MCIRDSLSGHEATSHSLLGSTKVGEIARRRVHERTYVAHFCLLYTSDAADERSSVDLGGRRIIKKKKKSQHRMRHGDR